MTEREIRLRDECEAKVRVGLKAATAVREAGEALKTLKDADLWRDTADSWDKYCHERFNITTRRASQLVEFAGMAKLYESTIGTACSDELPSEYAMRPLSGLPEDAVAEALAEAVEESGGVTPTPKAIRKAAAKRKPKRAKAKAAKPRTIRVGGAKVVIQPTHGEPVFRGYEATLEAAIAKLRAQSEPVVPVLAPQSEPAVPEAA